jgi:hypothetical protein
MIVLTGEWNSYNNVEGFLRRFGSWSDKRFLGKLTILRKWFSGYFDASFPSEANRMWLVK